MDSDINKILDELNEPRFLLAKQEAREIWKKHCNKEIPVILDVVIKAIAIPVKAAQLDCEGITRMDENGLYFIMYNANTSVTRQRFTVAHEIGHIALEHIHLGGDTSKCLQEKVQEKEANAFAGELLVPASDLKKFMKDKDRSIQDVMDRYQVSKDVAFYAINGNKLVRKIRT